MTMLIRLLKWFAYIALGAVALLAVAVLSWA